MPSLLLPFFTSGPNSSQVVVVSPDAGGAKRSLLSILCPNGSNTFLQGSFIRGSTCARAKKVNEVVTRLRFLWATSDTRATRFVPPHATLWRLVQLKSTRSSRTAYYFTEMHLGWWTKVLSTTSQCPICYCSKRTRRMWETRLLTSVLCWQRL